MKQGEKHQILYCFYVLFTLVVLLGIFNAIAYALRENLNHSGTTQGIGTFLPGSFYLHSVPYSD